MQTAQMPVHVKSSGTLRFWILLSLFILPISFIKIYDVDVWWHIQLGKSILAAKGWPDFSEFYFTPVLEHARDLRFTWLGDIFLYLIHHAAGDLGLQLFRLAAVFLLCFLLHQTAGDKKNKPWQLILLMLLVVGTYEKQLVRNSLFALMFCPLMFYLWWQIRYKMRTRLIWMYPFVIGLWGCIHGSYLLGFGLLALFLAGDGIDFLRGRVNLSRREMVRYAVVLILSFVLIAIANPMTTKRFGKKGIKKLFSATTSQKISVEADTQVDEQTNPFVSLKKMLNSTLFRPDSTQGASSDFTSPFDNLDRMFVWVSLSFGIITLATICFFMRPLRFSNLLPVLAVIFFGCGYLRLVGYIPIISTAVIFMAYGQGEIGARWTVPALPALNYLGVCIPVVMVLSVYLDLLFGFPVVVSTQSHVFGVGRIPYYSEKCADIILNEFPAQRIFTTRNNGGYLLERWYPQKKVFIDGFFAPHAKSVQQDYMSLINNIKTPDYLNQKYDVDMAILDYNSASIIRNFMMSENWYPRYLDEGQIFFIFEPDLSDGLRETKLLIGESEYESLTGMFKEQFAKILRHVSYYLVRKGRLQDAVQFEEDNQDLFSMTSGFIDGNYLSKTETLFENLQQAYGRINSKAIRKERLFTEAIEQQRFDEAIDLGLDVVGMHPTRYPVISKLAALFAERGEIIRCEEMLGLLVNAEQNDADYWLKEKNSIANLFLLLSRLKSVKEDFFSAYESLEKANRVDSDIISRDQLYKAGISMAHKLTLEEKPLAAYNLLLLMETDFPKSGRMMNEIAWHIISHPDQHFYSPENAKKFALDAVSFMKKDNDTQIDMAYDTAAEIYFHLKEYNQMTTYEDLAIQTAPAERRNEHNHRNIK
jgi:hypothetical protein